MFYFFLYALVGILVAIRIAIYAKLYLDEYEWRFNGSAHRSALILWPVFWPLLLFRPIVFINPQELFEVQWSLATVPRELDQLRANPPCCGRSIIYKPFSCYEDTYGEFVLHTFDAEEVLTQKLIENSHLQNDHEGDLLVWVQSRDDNVTEPQAVPSAWGRFQYVADDLIRDKKVIEIRCSECGVIDSSQLQTKDDKGRPGWNFNRLQCPAGHTLLMTEAVHLHLSDHSKK